MTRSVIEQIDANIQEARKTVALGNALDRLMQNQDFKAVILKGYFEQEPIRLVHLKAHPNMQEWDNQSAILRQMDAIGSLSAYFSALRHQASQASKQVADDEEMRSEILADGGDL